MDAFYLPREQYSGDKVREILEEWGVCVLVGHFEREDAEEWKERLVQWLCDLTGELKPDASAEQWDMTKLPSGSRKHMFQSLVGHAPVAWEIRKALYPLFSDIHDETRLLTSCDGASVYPMAPKRERTPSALKKDWPHVDQTFPDSIEKCVQAQVVLSDSKAAFRCTPRSHKQHGWLARHNISNWQQISEQEADELRRRDPSLQWQIPVHAPAGSVILWRSTTIHSAASHAPLHPDVARLAKTWTGTDLEDFGAGGWRCVLYVCMRPASRFSAAEKEQLRNAVLGGRTTNHWGTKVFPKKLSARFAKPFHAKIATLLENPQRLALDENTMCPLLKNLTAVEAYGDTGAAASLLPSSSAL